MENSLAAFQRAAAEGYLYLETDVHATADGVVVVQHDSELDRTTDGVGPIADQPWSAVRRAKIGGRESISRLEDLLEALPHALINIDVKAESALDPTLAVLRRTGALSRVCLASFDESRLRRARERAGPQLLTSMGPRSVGLLWAASWLPFRIPGLPVHGRFAQIPPEYGWLRVVDRALLRSAHRRDLEVHVWTINEEPKMNELLDLGVDGLVTDRPDLLRDILEARGLWVQQG
ncbi:glycerophosphoryl diester phosphodiesterase [Tamaricihabitans halophyticus]|uniref:Glycerophosphoryl diester phosphodiesterase n=2 Tax=Tamaricihabitans halophyticus TaxID=1262583 RepID=A0A4R2QPS9_9PSEU|nr:glycerophosphoryl diester phosphodiesterase [Tamaricihabitans halophyticus]